MASSAPAGCSSRNPSDRRQAQADTITAAITTITVVSIGEVVEEVAKEDTTTVAPHTEATTVVEILDTAAMIGAGMEADVSTRNFCSWSSKRGE
jgi:hypothetical protein